MGKSLLELFPGHASSPFLEAYRHVAETGETRILEGFYHGDSIPTPTWLRFAVVSMEKDIAILAQDITERKQVEDETQRLYAAVRQQRDTLSALVGNMPDEVWFADAQKKFTLANPSALREFALDSDSDIDIERFAASLEVYRPDGSPRPVEEAPPLRSLKGEVVRNLEEVIRIPACGELRHRQVSSSPVRDANGHIIGSVSVVRDITEQKRAEERLKEYEKVVEGLDEMIAVVDRDYRYLLANRSFLGYRDMEREAGPGAFGRRSIGQGGIFENDIRKKMEECFQGNVVKYEIKYNYPKRRR